jgi:hypothetical protein
MRRGTLLIFIAAGAALVGFAYASERVREDDSTPTATAPAKPQVAPLGWRESEGPSGQRLVFSVHRFEVLADGWRARVAVRNDSRVAFEVGEERQAFGLMLFSSGEHDDLETRNREGTLPTLRPALRYVPALPEVFEPKASWSGTISAPGALVAGSWVRFVFGPFVAIGRTPDGLPSQAGWITDRTYRLRG